MSSKGAFHQADLLDGRIRRLDARRLRQIAAVNSAFDADLLVMLQGAAPWLRKMVREGVANDTAKAHLLKELDAALDKLDPHERETDAPPALELEAPPIPRMPRPPSRLLRPGVRVAPDGHVDGSSLAPALDDQPLEAPPPGAKLPLQDSNEEWGLLPPLPPEAYPADGVDLPEAAQLRYPEPGEPAVVLPNGEVVAAEAAP